MASTFSPLLRIELIGAGEQSGAWNNTTNTNLGTLLEQAVAGVADITVSSTSYTLETSNGATDEARNMVLNVTGTPGAAFNVICPASDKVYIAKNGTTGGFAMTLKTSAGSGISIPNGRTMLLYCDGTNVVNGVNELPTGSTINGDVIATLTGTQTLSNKTLTAPKFVDGGFIADENGNEMIVFDTVASAVNEITLSNAATTGSPAIYATGGDTNINVNLVPKGSGVVQATGVEVATVSGAQTLSDKTLASPANVSATTGNAAIIAATGPDTDIDINISPKGAGSVQFGSVGGIAPTGSVIPFAGSTEPSGWILCYGQAVSRATYAALFAVVSTTYGSGDGSTTFNVPDLRGRAVAGKDDMGGTSADRLTGLADGVDGDTLGGAGGLESNTLTEAQMPAHKHGSGNLIKNFFDIGVYGNTTTDVPGLATDAHDSGFGGTGGTWQPWTQTVGSSAAHNNVQPTIILNYIIKS